MTTPSARSSPFWVAPLGLLLLAVAIVALYGRTVTFGFINLDDPQFIVDHPLLRGVTWGHVAGLWRPGSHPHEVLYIPVTYLSFLFDHAVGGGKPWAFHLTNLLLHLLNTLLVWQVVRPWCRRRLTPVLAAALFALHPLQAEAVCWAMGRKDLLAATGALLALAAWQRWTLYGRPQWLAATGCAFVLAVLAKPAVLALPAILALETWYRDGQLARPARRALLALALLAVALLALNQFTAPPADRVPLALAQNLPALPRLLTESLQRLALVLPPSPHALRTTLVAPESLALRYYLPALLVAALLALAWRHRWRAVLLAAGFAAAAVLPAAKVLLAERDFVWADRYGYLALVGLAWGLAALRDSGPAWRRHAVSAVLVLGLVAALPRTWSASGLWRDSEALWQGVLARDPGNHVAHTLLGDHYADHQRPTAAAQHYRQAITLAPGYAPPHTNLAGLYLAVGERALAARLYQRVVALTPADAEAHYNYGLALNQLDRHAAALYHTNLALRLAPDHIGARYNRGMIYQALGEDAAAEADYQAVVAALPGFVGAWQNLGELALRRGDAAAAAGHFRQALALAPELAVAHRGLARALLAQGDLTGARSHYARSLQGGLPHDPELAPRLAP